MRMNGIIMMVVASIGGPALAAPGELCDRAARMEFTETFTDGNEGGWSLSGRGAIVDREGDAYLRETHLATFAPWAMTARAPSAFTGDYRAAGVVELGAELRTFSANLTTRERPMSLVLVSDHGTPRDTTDDIYVFQVGRRNIPREVRGERAGWVEYRFEVPSSSATLPSPRSAAEGEPGWVITQGDLFTAPADPDAAWNTAIEDVDQVIFWFHDPRYFAFLQDWDVAMDNPTIVTCAE
jgi:hypothetical protein